MRVNSGWPFWMTLLFTAAVLAFIAASFRYREDARLVPLLVGIPTLILALLVLTAEINQGWASVLRLTRPKKGTNNHFGPEAGEPVGAKVLAICAWAVGLFVLILIFGFMVATPLFLLLFLRLYAHFGWPLSFGIAALMFAVVYGGFEILMQGDMFEGLFFGAVLPPF